MLKQLKLNGVLIMNQKKRNPKVKIPSYVKVASMLSPSSKGKIDRGYIKLMVNAIDCYNRFRSLNSKKFSKDLSDNE